MIITNNDSYITEKSTIPTIIGTGLICVDLIIENKEQSPFVSLGGTCGNVLAILSVLGWDVYPIGTFGNDAAGTLINDTFKSLNINTSFIAYENDVKTPVIIEKLKKNGKKKSSFSFKCDVCNAPLPRYKPIRHKQVVEILKKKTFVPTVFFFDRLSHNVLKIANELRDAGSIIVFEPYKKSTSNYFIQALQISHIIKYSSEDIRSLEEFSDYYNPLVEIQTLNSEGLRFRHSIGKKMSCWKTLKPFHIDLVKDPTGSGDWCTAGILNFLCKDGLANLKKKSESELENGMIAGQILGALNCLFIGALGALSTVKNSDIKDLFLKIQENRTKINFKELVQRKIQYKETKMTICVNCNTERMVKKLVIKA